MFNRTKQAAKVKNDKAIEQNHCKYYIQKKSEKLEKRADRNLAIRDKYLRKPKK